MNYLLVFILIFGSLQGMTKAPTPPANVGVRTLQYEDASRHRPVVIELWYPTAKQGPAAEVEAADAVWVHPQEIRNVALAEGGKKYPLIIFSHGHGGDRRNLSWLAESLVKNGFVVASVEHHGNSWRSYHPLTSLRFWERARDISFAINQVLKEPGLKDKIDANRIGFVGYSLGGMTGLALAGAKAENVKQIIQQQQKYHKEIEPELVSKLDFAEAHSDFEEPRIKAMVLLAPATFVYPSQSLKNIKIPIGLVASTGDEVLPFQEHALRVITHTTPAKLKVFNHKISHYVFLNRVSDAGKAVIREDMRAEPVQADRPSVHKEVAEFTSDFFKEQLK
jgi:predicted dienelactone hydrolase